MFNINFIVTLEKDEYRIVPEVPTGPVNLKSSNEVRNHQHRDDGFPKEEVTFSQGRSNQQISWVSLAPGTGTKLLRV